MVDTVQVTCKAWTVQEVRGYSRQQDGLQQSCFAKARVNQRITNELQPATLISISKFNHEPHLKCSLRC
jgi:hypothetical protein